ncbi:unnamed protein product, partial [Mesorhabditis spiculigera]
MNVFQLVLCFAGLVAHAMSVEPGKCEAGWFTPEREAEITKCLISQLARHIFEQKELNTTQDAAQLLSASRALRQRMICRYPDVVKACPCSAEVLKELREEGVCRHNFTGPYLPFGSGSEISRCARVNTASDGLFTVGRCIKEQTINAMMHHSTKIPAATLLKSYETRPELRFQWICDAKEHVEVNCPCSASVLQQIDFGFCRLTEGNKMQQQIAHRCLLNPVVLQRARSCDWMYPSHPFQKPQDYRSPWDCSDYIKSIECKRLVFDACMPGAGDEYVRLFLDGTDLERPAHKVWNICGGQLNFPASLFNPRPSPPARIDPSTICDFNCPVLGKVSKFSLLEELSQSQIPPLDCLAHKTLKGQAQAGVLHHDEIIHSGPIDLRVIGATSMCNRSAAEEKTLLTCGACAQDYLEMSDKAMCNGNAINPDVAKITACLAKDPHRAQQLRDTCWTDTSSSCMSSTRYMACLRDELDKKCPGTAGAWQPMWEKVLDGIDHPLLRAFDVNLTRCLGLANDKSQVHSSDLPRFLPASSFSSSVFLLSDDAEPQNYDERALSRSSFVILAVLIAFLFVYAVAIFVCFCFVCGIYLGHAAQQQQDLRDADAAVARRQEK